RWPPTRKRSATRCFPTSRPSPGPARPERPTAPARAPPSTMTTSFPTTAPTTSRNHAHRRDPSALADLLRRPWAHHRAERIVGVPGPLDPVHDRRDGSVHPVHRGDRG